MADSQKDPVIQQIKTNVVEVLATTKAIDDAKNPAENTPADQARATAAGYELQSKVNGLNGLRAAAETAANRRASALDAARRRNAALRAQRGK